MRAVVQRVKKAVVSVDGLIKGSIGKGLLVYAGIEAGDGPDDIDYVASKVASLRLFEDSSGKMNLDLKEAGAKVLVISQFTLLADCRKGRRPSFDRAEAPQKARELYEKFLEALRGRDVEIECGVFQAHMEVDYVNDGPVTMILDSRKAF